MVEIYLDVMTSWWFWGVLILVVVFYAIQKSFDLPKQNYWLRGAVRDHYVVWAAAFGAIILVVAYQMYLRDIVWAVHAMVGRLREFAEDRAGSDTIDIGRVLNNLAQGSALLLGVLVAAATLIFTLLRMWINERTTRATEEGLITDRINAAVASLGADKTVKGFESEKEYTCPNIEVRVGAILALERIAKRSPDVHIQIMEILCAYIRENTKEELENPREDIQMALTVIGRRSENAIAMEPTGLIDLRDTHLMRADLEGARLPTAQLDRAQLNGADLYHAQLNGADLRGAQLNGANLTGAQLNESYLPGAQLNEAYLSRAQLNGADLRFAKLDEAYLIEAQLNGANLSKARLNEAYLRGAQLDGAYSLTDAELRGVLVENLDFTDVTITREKLYEMFGDASVILPEALQPPPTHWPRVVLGWIDIRSEREKWLADPDGYVFDPTQYGDRYTNPTEA